ncbi:MAG: hypothetical protein ACPGNT_04345 [Rhodospirillales bacterium]
MNNLPDIDAVRGYSAAINEWGLVAIGVILFLFGVLVFWFAMGLTEEKGKYRTAIAASLTFVLGGVSLAVWGALIEKPQPTFVLKFYNVPKNITIEPSQSHTFVKSVPLGENTRSALCMRNWAIAHLGPDVIRLNLIVDEQSAQCSRNSGGVIEVSTEPMEISTTQLEGTNMEGGFDAKLKLYLKFKEGGKKSVTVLTELTDRRSVPVQLSSFGLISSALAADSEPAPVGEDKISTFEYASLLMEETSRSDWFSGVRVLAGDWDNSRQAVYEALKRDDLPEKLREGYLYAYRSHLQGWMADKKKASGDGAAISLPPYDRDLLDGLLKSAISPNELVRSHARALIRSKPTEGMIAAVDTFAQGLDGEKIKYINGVKADLYYNVAIDMALQKPDQKAAYALPAENKETVETSLDLLEKATALRPQSLDSDQFLFAKAAFGEGLINLTVGAATADKAVTYAGEEQGVGKWLDAADKSFSDFLGVAGQDEAFPYPFFVKLAEQCRPSNFAEDQRAEGVSKCLGAISAE